MKKIKATEGPGRTRIVRTPAEERKKHEADKKRRRDRRAAQKAEAAEALQLEEFSKMLANGEDPSASPLAATGKMPVAAHTQRNKGGVRLRDDIITAFHRLGGVDGLVKFGQMFPKEFYTQIMPKVLPRTQELDVSENLEDILSQLGGGKVPGLLEGPAMVDAEYEEVEDD